jgi:hypothetical protein
MGGRRWILGLVGAVLFAAVAAVVVVTVPGTWLVARGVLAGVLLLAGAAKLRDRAAFVVVLEGLGVPTVLRRAIARGLPVVEIAVAVALLVPVSSTAGGIAALAVLLVLSGVVLVALARARSLDCGCFGEDHSTPLSGTTLLRNGALVGLAAGIALASPAAQTAALGASASARSLVALGSATLMVAALLLATRRLPRTVANQPNTSLEVVAAGGTPTSPVTRRGLIRTAAGAGAAGALGASLGWLDPSTARAALTTSTTADKLSCGECQCCRFDTIIGEICRERCCVICPGFAGGGVIQTATGTAQASFFGDTVQLKGSRQLVTGGGAVVV